MTRHAVAPYAERLSYVPDAFDLGVAQTVGAWGARLARIAGVRSHAQRVKSLAALIAGLSDIALLAEAASLRPRLLRQAEMLQPRLFAMVHVAVERHMGLRYHPVQLAGGRALTGRRVVEMATGEGKTITAVLPAVAAALAGKPVHVVTVNDYLAERDANDPDARRQATSAACTYVTNKELSFDDLKDRIATAASRGDARHKAASLFGDTRGGLLLRADCMSPSSMRRTAC